jgi:hypothetical protein
VSRPGERRSGASRLGLHQKVRRLEVGERLQDGIDQVYPEDNEDALRSGERHGAFDGVDDERAVRAEGEQLLRSLRTRSGPEARSNAACQNDGERTLELAHWLFVFTGLLSGGVGNVPAASMESQPTRPEIASEAAT